MEPEKPCTIEQQAQLEALQAYAPPPGYKHPGTYTTWDTNRWMELCREYASGTPIVRAAAKLHIPISLVWRWASMPILADIWAQVRKDHSHSIMANAHECMHLLSTGEWTKDVTVPGKGEMLARARSLLDAGRLAMDIAAKINPDEYSDRLQIDKRQVSAVYVVAYDSQAQVGREPSETEATCVPSQDKVGVERAALTQSWRKAIAKERKLKLKQLASSDT